jgi:hypothetical protein
LFLRLVDSWTDTNVSEKHTVSILRAEDGDYVSQCCYKFGLLNKMNPYMEKLVLTSSRLKMERVRFSETMVFAYYSTWRYNPEEHHQHNSCDNLKSQKI